jgi:hypothetical protein
MRQPVTRRHGGRPSGAVTRDGVLASELADCRAHHARTRHAEILTVTKRVVADRAPNTKKAGLAAGFDVIAWSRHSDLNRGPGVTNSLR